MKDIKDRVFVVMAKMDGERPVIKMGVQGSLKEVPLDHVFQEMAEPDQLHRSQGDGAGRREGRALGHRNRDPRRRQGEQGSQHPQQPASPQVTVCAGVAQPAHTSAEVSSRPAGGTGCRFNQQLQMDISPARQAGPTQQSRPAGGTYHAQRPWERGRLARKSQKMQTPSEYSRSWRASDTERARRPALPGSLRKPLPRAAHSRQASQLKSVDPPIITTTPRKPRVSLLCFQADLTAAFPARVCRTHLHSKVCTNRCGGRGGSSCSRRRSGALTAPTVPGPPSPDHWLRWPSRECTSSTIVFRRRLAIGFWMANSGPRRRRLVHRKRGSSE